MFKVANARTIELPSFSAADGSTLTFAESNVHAPFEIKRIYYIYNFGQPGVSRGGHAHKSLEQVFFCLNGKFVFRLDDGVQKQDVEMIDPAKGLYVGPGLWHVMDEIDPGTVILAVASDLFNESDYLRDYQEFLLHVSA